ncbi:MAG: BON domain-containing protein [Pirellulales bacterium]|nr:BON domain-containing protein [Pirellulales bacterium]
MQNASYAALRNVTCEYTHGVLTLHGKVPSYYQKQLAQETVRRIDGIRQIINEIEVLAPGESHLR